MQIYTNYIYNIECNNIMSECVCHVCDEYDEMLYDYWFVCEAVVDHQTTECLIVIVL